jgi:hypothetical protein
MTMSLAEAASADDQRSPMAALIPSQTVCGDKVPTIEFEPADPAVMMLWLGVANSLALDFVVGMKVSLKMSMSLMASLAFPRRVSSDDATARACACARAARLSCAGPQMLDLLRTVERVPALAGLDLTSSNDPEERDRLAAELDVVVNLSGQRYTKGGWKKTLSVLMTACVAEAAKRQIEFAPFSLQDCRPKGVSDKLERGDSDTMDATLHSNERMIRDVYDRRRRRVAKPAG